MVNSRATAQSSPMPDPRRPAGAAGCALARPELVGVAEFICGRRPLCAPETIPRDAASTPRPAARAGASPFGAMPVEYRVGSAFVSFHTLIAVSRQSYAAANLMNRLRL